MSTMMMGAVESSEISILLPDNTASYSKREHTSRIRPFGLLRPSRDAVDLVSLSGNDSETMFVKKNNPYAENIVTDTMMWRIVLAVTRKQLQTVFNNRPSNISTVVRGHVQHKL